MLKYKVNPDFFKALINDLIDRGCIKNKSDLASRISVPRSTISDIFSGRNQVSLDKLINISIKFNVLFTINNGSIDYKFIDENENLDPIFQESINYLIKIYKNQPEKITQFTKSLINLLKKK